MKKRGSQQGKGILRNRGTFNSSKKGGIMKKNDTQQPPAKLTDAQMMKKHGINLDFERKSTDFFTGKSPPRDLDETNSLFNKKTFETTDMDMSQLEGSEDGKKDLIYDDTRRNTKPITRVIIENPVLSNLFFQMLIFYNFFYFWLQFFIFFTMMINKLWVFDYQNYRDYIGYGCIIFYFIIELCSCYFGYRGNINETVSDSNWLIMYIYSSQN